MTDLVFTGDRRFIGEVDDARSEVLELHEHEIPPAVAFAPVQWPDDEDEDIVVAGVTIPRRRYADRMEDE